MMNKFSRYYFESMVEKRAARECCFVGTTAALIMGGLAAAGAVGGSAIQAHAAGSAAKTEAAAGDRAAELARTAGDTANAKLTDVFGQQQALLSPYANTSQFGIDQLMKALAPGGGLTSQFSYNPADVANDPAYQFQLQQGMDAVKRAAAAGGTLNSGGTLKALEQYAQGVAGQYENQDYGQALTTFNTNRNNTLQNLGLPIQTGEFGTSNLLSALQNYGNQFSTNTLNTAQIQGADLTGSANARAAGTIGQGNAYSSGLSSLSSLAQLATMFGAMNGSTPSAAAPLPAPTGFAAQLRNPMAQLAPSAFSTQPLSPYGASYYGAPFIP